MAQDRSVNDRTGPPVGSTSGPQEARKLHARTGGRATIGGDLEVHRIGFGAMRLVGDGPGPSDREDRRAAIHALDRARELGVNLIDTADSYGPNVSEELIREALDPYDEIVIATKGGRDPHGVYASAEPVGRPESLRQSVMMSLDRLGREYIDVWQLHRIDPDVPRDEQFDAMKKLQDDGLVRHLGLSEVSVDEIDAAREVFAVATVQNRYNLTDRHSEDVLDYCEDNDIVFIASEPLAAGDLAREGSILDEVAGEVEAKPGQVALAWLLKRSPVVVPIPGTRDAAHLRENIRAGRLALSDEDYEALDEAGRRGWEEKRRQDRHRPAPPG
ncbi:MAG TPA: aldo/keto reductase [Trueperaceae bacterium]|nr:aldo/keto reductase [Trueperaceae bacterium]